MTQTDSPLKRSIGLSGVIRFLIVVVAVVAVGAAFAADHYALGIAAVVFFVVAAVLGYGASRARRSAGPARQSSDSESDAV